MTYREKFNVGLISLVVLTMIVSLTVTLIDAYQEGVLLPLFLLVCGLVLFSLLLNKFLDWLDNS